MTLKAINKAFGNNWVVAVTLLVFSVPALLKLILPGFYEPHDLHHFADIYQMYRAFVSGQIPPRWGPDFLYNFGYPLFNFYYVIPFYLGAGFLSLFGSIQLAYKLVFIVSVLAGVCGMYILLREFVGKLPAFVGSVVFLYTPYRAVQIYVRGAMGEALSLALLPLIAYSLIKIVKSPGRLKYTGLTGILGAVFILTHNYMWALSFPWIIVLALIFTEKNKIWTALKSLLLSGVLMIGGSAYWWLPALSEQKLVAATTPFPLADHFPFIKQLVIPFWGYGASIEGIYDGLSFNIGTVNLVGVLASLILVVFARKYFGDRRLRLIAFWGIGSFFITCFMMNIRSLPVWNALPFHDFVQFPWRLLAFTTFFSAVLTAVSVEVLQKNAKLVAGLGLSAFSVMLTFNYFQPSHIAYKSDNEYLSRFFADRTFQGTKEAVSADYLNYSEDYLLLPKTAEKKPDFLPKEKITSQTAKVEDILQTGGLSWSATVTAERESAVSLNSLYFPGWTAAVDNRGTNVGPGTPYGEVQIIVPVGVHEVAFGWHETPSRRRSDWISVMFFALALAFVLKPRRARIQL